MTRDARRASRLLGAGALLLAAACGLLLFLNYAKFAATFENRSRERVAIIARDAAKALEAQLALGLALSDTAALRNLLARPLQNDPMIAVVSVLDDQGALIIAEGQGQPGLREAARAGPANQDYHYVRQGDRAAIAMALHNAFNVRAGWLVVEYPLDEARAQLDRALASLWPAGLGALAAALTVLLLVGARLAGKGDAAGTTPAAAHPGRNLTLLLTGLLFFIQAVFALEAYHSFRRITAGEAPQLAATLVLTLNPTLERALGYGIPLQELRGVEEWLAMALNTGPEFSSLAVMDARSRVLFEAAAPATNPANAMFHEYPLRHDGQVVGALRVGLDQQALSERMRQLIIEFLMLLLAGALLIHEVLVALTAPPVRDGAPTAATLRLPLALFFVGSELPRSFLPVWSNELAARPIPEAWVGGPLDPLAAWLAVQPPTVLATAPIAVFLLAVALSSPFAGRYSSRHGPRRLLLFGMALAFAGHVLAIVADSLLMLGLARIVAGASFGAVSLAAFDLIGRLGGGRAAGMAMYLTAYVSSGIAGAGLGALIVDRAGIPAVFGFGALCSLLGALALRRFPRLPEQPLVKRPIWATLGVLATKPAFLRLVVLTALPLQIVQQGLLFYWTPLSLMALGERTSVTGLAMMGYFLMVLLLNAPLARSADRLDLHKWFVIGGLGLMAIAGVLVGVFLTPAPIVVSVVLIGLAWAMAFPSQGAMVLRVSHTVLPGVDPAVSLGVYRSVERIGAMLSPMLVGVLIVIFGYAGSAIAMGALLGVCALAQAVLSRGKQV